jgi:hypothetical protein
MRHPKKSLTLGIVGGVLLSAAMAGAPTFAASSMPVSFHAWNGNDFREGTFANTKLIYGGGRQVLTLASGTTDGTWTSRTFTTPTQVNKIVTSWQVATPQSSSIMTRLQVELPNGTWSSWYDMGRWALATTKAGGVFTSQRGSVDNQADDIGLIAQDTFYANDNVWAKAYRVQEELYGNTTGPQPTVRQVAATAADISQDIDENGGVSPTSNTTMTHTVDLTMPKYSEYAHDNEYPQLDNVGEAWCSPASVSMVLGYYGKGPSKQQITHLPADPVFVGRTRVDGAVDYAAYHIFDNTDPDKDTGDWPFNTAYAASFGMDTSVRQYNSLQGIESWVKKGVPIVVSIKWDNSSSDPTQHLDSSSIVKTDGHLMVVRGFTKDGDVLTNDPASPDDAAVPHTYQRSQFEHLWLRASSGTVYVIQPQTMHG